MIITSSYQAFQAGFPCDRPEQTITIPKRRMVKTRVQKKDLSYIPGSGRCMYQCDENGEFIYHEIDDEEILKDEDGNDIMETIPMPYLYKGGPGIGPYQPRVDTKNGDVVKFKACLDQAVGVACEARDRFY